MMSNNNTTDTQNSKNKQVWLDTLVSLPSETTPQQTPKVAAQEYIQAHVELLHNDIATILKKIGYIHTNLLHKLRNKIVQKREDEIRQWALSVFHLVSIHPPHLQKSRRIIWLPWTSRRDGRLHRHI